MSLLFSHCSVIICIMGKWLLYGVAYCHHRHRTTFAKNPFANFLYLSMQVVSCINIALFCHQNYGHHQHDNNNQTWECGWRSHSWKSSTTPAHPPSTWRPGWRSPSHLSRTWDPSQGQCWACLCRAPMPRKAWGKMQLLKKKQKLTWPAHVEPPWKSQSSRDPQDLSTPPFPPLPLCGWPWQG